MALQFRGFPQREQKPRDYSDILIPLAALGQGVQGYLNQEARERQLALQDAANAREQAQENRVQFLHDRMYSPTGAPQGVGSPSSYPQMADAGVADYQPLLTPQQPQKSGLVSEWNQKYGPQMGQSRADYAEQLGHREKEQGFRKGEADIEESLARAKYYRDRPSTPQYVIPTYDAQGNVSGFTPVPQGMKPMGGGRPINQRGVLSNQAISTTYNLYETARDGLLSGLEGTVTGPFMGKVPALTSNQQTAEGAVAAMAPVLKQLFRVAGEGVFTDRDQALLLQMIPTRDTLPEARAKQIQNIDNIVKAKLGISDGFVMPQNNAAGRITQRNKRTGQIRYSDDGGRTWQMQ